MKTLLRVAAVALLVWLLAPEIPRYRAERRIGLATSAFRSLIDRVQEPEATQEILRSVFTARSPRVRLRDAGRPHARRVPPPGAAARP